MESTNVQSDSYIESEKTEFNATSTTKFFFFNFRSLCLLIYIVEIILSITTSIVSNKRIFNLEHLNEICTVLSIV